MNQNAPRGCAARGDEVYAEHTARARKCATSAHFILTFLVIADLKIRNLKIHFTDLKIHFTARL